MGRARRIAEARRNGQLLMHFSSHDTTETEHNPAVHQEVIVPTENSTSSNKESKIDEGLIQKMSDEVSRLAQYQKEATHERRNSDAQLLQKVQEMIQEKEMTASTKSLSVLQSTTKVLEQNNSKLIEEMKQLNAKFVHEAEAHVIQTTQLEMKVQQAQGTIVALEGLKSDLENQLSTLQSEYTATLSSSKQLKNELVIAQKELNSTRKEMEELKYEKSNETQECVDKIYDLQKTCNELMRFMEEENATHTKTKNDLRSKEEAIQRLHSDTIPNLQATIEAERDTVARLEQALELRRQEVDQANLDIERLQEKIQSLQNQYDELQLNAQTAEEKHQRIVEELANARLDMEKHGATEEQMKLQIAQLTDTNGELQKSNDSFVTQQKQLNDALEDAMVQLDQVENEKRTVEQSLKQALQQIDTIQKSLSLTNSEASEMIQKLSEQVNAERGLREEAETMRKELDTMVQSQNSDIVTLQQQVQLTIQERDVARNNMDGYNEREQKLYEQLQHYEHVRRDMHSKLIQLMGNIRVFIRIRPRLPHEEATKRDAVDAPIAKKPRKDGDENVDQEIFRFPGLFDSSHDDAIQKQSTARLATATSTNNIDASKNMIEVTAPYKYRGGLNDRRQQWTFGFDRVFAPAHSQNDIWEATDPLIQCAVDGYHVTVFAYGQTGSGVRALRNVIVVPNEIDVVVCEISPFFCTILGLVRSQKTFTMLGEEGINEGIIGRTVRKLFDEKQKIIDLSRGESNITISVELLEIYNEKVRDLLSSGREDLKLTSNEVVGNILVETNTVSEVLQVLKLAQGRRCVKSTNSNSESSRSHMIFTIHFKVTMNDGVTIRNGKVNICDLAGSERLDKSGANIVGVRFRCVCVFAFDESTVPLMTNIPYLLFEKGALLEETKNINKSLSVLSNVIEKLQAGDTKNVPFRESKLTYLLKDSLSGNSKTLAIICCNPLASHMNESLCSLRFAEKVNRVDLKAVANFSC